MPITAESTSFDGKHHLTYTDTGKSHIYKLDGKRIPGATAVGACYPKGEGLIRWLVQQGIEEYDKGTKLKAAATIGKIVHKYAECHMKGEPFDWSLVESAADSHIVAECISQYDALAAHYCDDKLYAAELLVASPTLQVATQVDAVILRDGDVITRDYKTGKKIYISALHQTVLGRRLLREWKDINSNKLEIIKFSKDTGTVQFEHCLVDNEGMTINSLHIPYKGLLDELELQMTRNVETYKHKNGVEALLEKYYDDQRR